MRYRKTRRFRHRSNGRNNHPRSNGVDPTRLRTNSFTNDRVRNNFKSPQEATKLVERYNALAKEALSSGDRVSAENYFQYADHFMRIIDEKKLNQNHNKIQVKDEKKINSNVLSQDSESTSDQATREKKE